MEEAGLRSQASDGGGGIVAGDDWAKVTAEVYWSTPPEFTVQVNPSAVRSVQVNPSSVRSVQMRQLAAENLKLTKENEQLKEVICSLKRERKIEKKIHKEEMRRYERNVVVCMILGCVVCCMIYPLCALLIRGFV